MHETEEWRMVQELYEIHDELPELAEEFIMNLYRNIDPCVDFRLQLIGLPMGVEKQMKWLYSLYERYINFDTDAAQEYWDDDNENL